MQARFDLFLTTYRAAWRSDQFTEVLNLWDPEEAEPWHFPEELNQPLVGRNAIAEYLELAGQAIGEFSVEVSDAHIKPMAEQHFVFRFAMRWQATMRSQMLFSKPIGANVRVSGVLRETDDGLKLVHYMEAGPAALPFVLAQYEQFAASHGAQVG